MSYISAQSRTITYAWTVPTNVNTGKRIQVLTLAKLPAYNERMNKKALKAAQETLDREYKKLDRAYLRTIKLVEKIIDEEIIKAKLAKRKRNR